VADFCNPTDVGILSKYTIFLKKKKEKERNNSTNYTAWYRREKKPLLSPTGSTIAIEYISR